MSKFQSLLLYCIIALAGCESKVAQRQVILYCSADQEYAQRIIDDFTKQTGIKVLCRYDTEATKTLGLIQRLRSEADHPQADVFWSSEIFETINLAAENIVSPYPAKSTKNEYSDPQGRWYGFALRARVLAYNTKLLKKDQAPKSIEDLLDSKWKNKIVMARPQFGTTRGHIGAIWTHYGPKRAQEIFHSLKQNSVRLVSSNSMAVRQVAEGQMTIALTDSDDVWAAQRNGWPVELVYPKHAQAGTLLIPNTAAMVRNGPNPREAAQLMDYLLSEKVELDLAKSDFHNIPTRPNLKQQFPQYNVPEPMKANYTQIAAELNDAVRSAANILGN